MRTPLLALGLLASALLAAAPVASAERITGCVDGDGDSSDCALGREFPCAATDVDLSCLIVCVRECVPIPGPDCIAIRECDPNQ